MTSTTQKNYLHYPVIPSKLSLLKAFNAVQSSRTQKDLGEKADPITVLHKHFFSREDQRLSPIRHSHPFKYNDYTKNIVPFHLNNNMAPLKLNCDCSTEIGQCKEESPINKKFNQSTKMVGLSKEVGRNGSMKQLRIMGKNDSSKMMGMFIVSDGMKYGRKNTTKSGKSCSTNHTECYTSVNERKVDSVEEGHFSVVQAIQKAKYNNMMVENEEYNDVCYEYKDE